MTYHEMKALKVGDKILYKTFNIELTVWDVTIDGDVENYWIQAETESHVSIEFGYRACGEFDVIKKPKKYIIHSTYTEHYETEEEAMSEDEAIEKHFDHLMGARWGEVEYYENERDVVSVTLKEE